VSIITFRLSATKHALFLNLIHLDQGQTKFQFRFYVQNPNLTWRLTSVNKTTLLRKLQKFKLKQNQ